MALEPELLNNPDRSSDSMTVDCLMKYYSLADNDCDQPISDSHLDDISLSHCGQWRLLPCRLGMKNIVTGDINRDFAIEKEKRREFFFEWKQIRGSDATYKSLISALLAIKSREDAESICKILQISLSTANGGSKCSSMLYPMHYWFSPFPTGSSSK